jgi:hypothetical protein
VGPSVAFRSVLGRHSVTTPLQATKRRINSI